MEVSIVQIALIFIVTFIAAIDQFDLLESLYQPIVTGPIVGAILGNVELGLVVGGTYQLMTSATCRLVALSRLTRSSAASWPRFSRARSRTSTPTPPSPSPSRSRSSDSTV